MTAREAGPLLQDALGAVGRLTAGQAGRLLDVEPALAARFLGALTRDGLALNYRGAWWAPTAKRTATRHRALLGDIYVELARDRRLHAWKSNGGEGTPRPDAWVSWHESDTSALLSIALEADTGTETTRQWDAKLAEYRLLPAPPPLLIVATRPGRAQRLKELAASAGMSACGTTVEGLLTALQTWHPQNSGPHEESGETSLIGPRPALYMREGRPVSQTEAAAKIKAGRWRLGAREYRAGQDVQHVVDGRAPFFPGSNMFRRRHEGQGKREPER